MTFIIPWLLCDQGCESAVNCLRKMSLTGKLIRSVVKYLRDPHAKVPNAIKTGAIKTHTGAVRYTTLYETFLGL